MNGKQLPKLNQNRQDHACLFDKATSSMYVMGGLYNNGVLDSTEKWTLGTDSWIPLSSAKLPEPLMGSRAVPANSNEYIGYIAGGYRGYVNGIPNYSSKIWGLKKSNMKWTQLTKTMKIGRSDHSLLNVPYDEVLGC